MEINSYALILFLFKRSHDSTSNSESDKTPAGIAKKDKHAKMENKMITLYIADEDETQTNPFPEIKETESSFFFSEVYTFFSEVSFFCFCF